MSLAHHDRLDVKLHTLQHTRPECGSLNLWTGQAEYCGYDCPTLKARMQAGEDPGVPTNPTEVYPSPEPFDPTKVA